MPRLARVVVEGLPHHVTQRGNRKQNVFIDDTDRRVYLRLLGEWCEDAHLRIWAYTLMTNHVHLIAVPEQSESISVALQRVHGDYARYSNARHGQVGHVWQGRFKSTVLDDRHLWNAVRYVERNPVRASIVARAEDYPWSSAAAHCGLRDDPLLDDGLPLLDRLSDWAAWLRDEDPPETVDLLRKRTRTGRPCGDGAFLKALERQLGRVLEAQKPGPKAKAN